MSLLLKLLPLLKGFDQAKAAAAVKLLVSFVKLFKGGGSLEDAMAIVVQLFELFSGKEPTPPVVFSAASPVDESAVISEAVAMGCKKADLEALVAELK